MERDKEFIREHGKTLRVVLRNSKLSTDKLERRVESMRRTLKDNHEDIARLDAIERRIRSIIDNTGKDQFSEEEIDIIMRQELGLEIREYDKSHLVNLELGEIESVTPHPVKEPKPYTFGDTTITKIGFLTYKDWMGMEDLAGLPYYKIDRQTQSGKVYTYKVFSHINIGLMDSDKDYRAAVIDTLLDENNMTKTNCGGYIGSIETVAEGSGLQDTVKANSRYSLVFDSTDATAVVKLRNIVKEKQEQEAKAKQDGERE